MKCGCTLMTSILAGSLLLCAAFLYSILFDFKKDLGGGDGSFLSCWIRFNKLWFIFAQYVFDEMSNGMESKDFLVSLEVQ